MQQILIYKRTHKNDPDQRGRFGIHGCMGRVRGYAFDAVIGVGGTSGWPQAEGIARKVNWVGRSPQRRPNPIDSRGPLVTFRHGDYRVLEDRGPLLASMSGPLAAAVYGSRNRFLFKSIRGQLAIEAMRVINELLDTDHYPEEPERGPGLGDSGGRRRCRPNGCPPPNKRAKPHRPRRRGC
jgi:hypothetical protein